MANLDSVLKKRDIILLTKGLRVKVMLSPPSHPIVMSGCESWTTKKAEH